MVTGIGTRVDSRTPDGGWAGAKMVDLFFLGYFLLQVEGKLPSTEHFWTPVRLGAAEPGTYTLRRSA